MSFLVLLGIAIAMAMDTFAVAVGLSCSARGLDRRAHEHAGHQRGGQARRLIKTA